MNNERERLRAGFHELTLNLLGLFEVYDASPELVDHTGEVFERVIRTHLDGGRPPNGARGKLALERLLDELEAAEAAETTTH